MNGFLIFYLIVLWIANVYFCAWLAGQKDRSVTLWAFLGVILPGLAIVAIAGATNEHSYLTKVNGGTKKTYWEDDADKSSDTIEKRIAERKYQEDRKEP